MLNFLTSLFYNSPFSSAGRVKSQFSSLMGASKPTLPQGKYVQVYMDAIRGNLDAKIRYLEPKLDKLKSLGIKGILFHTASYERILKLTAEDFRKLAKLCSDRDMLCIGAFGLGTSYPEETGAHIGMLANLPECFAVVFDMEGAWEVKEGKAKAILIGKAFRKVSPTALALDQPWADPTYHWTAFPWEETAAFLDGTFPQFYVNNWKSQHGAKRYEICWTRFLTAWAKLKRRLEPKGLARPMFFTIQGYKWVFRDLVNCLTTNPTMFIWAEPYPDDVFIAALEVVQALEVQGFTGPNAVKDFQTKWNLNHPGDLIGTDNICGPITVRKLGLPLPPISE